MKRYTVEWNQGVIVRQDGNLAADYVNGEFVWVNPKLDIPARDLEKIRPECKELEENNYEPG